LKAGTYSTQVFQRKLTYTVPNRWSNFEDLAGNFLLMPPSGTLRGGDAGTSDYIGVYSDVALEQGCTSEHPEDVETTPASYAKWLRTAPGFLTTNQHSVAVGALHGTVQDLRMASTWKKTCDYSNGVHVLPLMSGLALADFDHSLLRGMVIRLYLLGSHFNGSPTVLAIEVDDVKDSGHRAAESAVVRTFRFGG